MYSSLNFKFHNSNLSRAYTYAHTSIQMRSNFPKECTYRAGALARRGLARGRRTPASRRSRKPSKSVMRESLMTTNGVPCMQVNAQGPTSWRSRWSLQAIGGGNSWFHCGDTHAEIYDIAKKNWKYTIKRRRDVGGSSSPLSSTISRGIFCRRNRYTGTSVLRLGLS